MMDVGEQFEVVRDLLARQDEVLQELDALEARVEQMIQEILGSNQDPEEDDISPQPVAA